MQSRDTTLRLLARVMRLKPHETKETLSLNEARNYIIALSKPMGEAVDLINGNLEEMKDIKELKSEKDYIYECASYFGVFLKKNALIPYNDSFADYLDMLIKEEECKERKIRDDKKIERMKREKKTYEEKKRVIMGNLASTDGSSHEVISAEIHKRKDKLCSLRRNGESLRTALGIVVKYFTIVDSNTINVS